MKKLTIEKESSTIEIVEFIKKYGVSFNIVDKNTIEIYMKSGNIKVFYLDDDGKIIASVEYLKEECTK